MIINVIRCNNTVQSSTAMRIFYVWFIQRTLSQTRIHAHSDPGET
jgi:hypothetical protein